MVGTKHTRARVVGVGQGWVGGVDKRVGGRYTGWGRREGQVYITRRYGWTGVVVARKATWERWLSVAGRRIRADGVDRGSGVGREWGRDRGKFRVEGAGRGVWVSGLGGRKMGQKGGRM